VTKGAAPALSAAGSGSRRADLGDAMRTGVYPGTFDPLTLGHLDIIRRSSKIVDKLVVGISTNPAKVPLFTLEERLHQVERETADLEIAVEAVSFDELLINFARRVGAQIILRGLRAVSDFEYEYQMAGMNQQLDHHVETVFLMADVALQPIASRLVKEIARYGGDVRPFVPSRVADELMAKLGRLQP
jgi:pantetheine-phosphate adenylyltransferase